MRETAVDDERRQPDWNRLLGVNDTERLQDLRAWRQANRCLDEIA